METFQSISPMVTVPEISCDMLHAPDIAMTLVSMGLIDDTGYSTTFMDGTCTIHHKSSKIIGCIPKCNRLYCVNAPKIAAISAIPLRVKLTIMEAH